MLMVHTQKGQHLFTNGQLCAANGTVILVRFFNVIVVNKDMGCQCTKASLHTVHRAHHRNVVHSQLIHN